METARYYVAMLGSKSDDPNCKISDFSAELLRHEKSDKNGSAFSPYYLGCLYQLGICPDKTAVDMYRCFKRSFQRGYDDARLKMLEMASNDSVIKSDRVYLRMVLEGAVHQGDARASELLANPLFSNK